MESIHHEFVTTTQTMSSRYYIFTTISEWISSIRKTIELDATDDINSAALGVDDKARQKLRGVLSKEVETWELLVKLYYYRLMKPERNGTDFEMSELVNEKINESGTVCHMIENVEQLKEISLIIEWLESSYADKNMEPVITGRDISWENTLAALKRDTLYGKVTSEFMVTQFDPDACVRENKKLQQLDLDEEAMVQKGAFHYLRRGEPQKTICFLKDSGHIAKSAMLHGYEFSKIVNVEDNLVEANEEMETTRSGTNTYRVLGNTERDLWKRIAFLICDANDVPEMEKAIIGALCGHRQSMLNVAINWEDKLWAYLKTLLDVQIEERLRTGSIDYDSYVSLPDQYWSQKLTLAESIAKINDGVGSDDVTVDNLFTIIQEYIILDDVGGLLQMINQNIGDILVSNEDPAVIGHINRFLTHLILFLGVVELDGNFKREEEIAMNICSEAYITVLVRVKQFCYIPFYVNKVSEDRQINAVVSQISPSLKLDVHDINCFLEAAVLNDLNILQIAIAVVEKLRTTEDDFNVQHLHWIAATYEYGDEKPKTMISFLKYTLLISRKYVVLGDLRKVRMLINEINDLCINEVITYSEHYKDTYIKELLCYKAYLDADAALELWRKATQQKPNEQIFLANSIEQEKTSTPTLAERTRKESRKLTFDEANKKWKNAVDLHLKTAIEKFIKLLKFPQGWLLDCASTVDDDKESDDETTIIAVRRIVLPKIIRILLKLVNERKSQEVMREFLYTFCDDSRHIYQEMPAADIAIVFKSIEEFTRVSAESLSSD